MVRDAQLSLIHAIIVKVLDSMQPWQDIVMPSVARDAALASDSVVESSG